MPTEVTVMDYCVVLVQPFASVTVGTAEYVPFAA